MIILLIVNSDSDSLKMFEAEELHVYDHDLRTCEMLTELPNNRKLFGVKLIS